VGELPVLSASYLPSCRASQSFCHYQYYTVSNRATCVWTACNSHYRKVEWPSVGSTWPRDSEFSDL